MINNLHSNLNYKGIIASIFIILGFFSPWLIYYYDPYPTINPETNTGQLEYHSRVELSPLYGSVYKDGKLVERILFISTGLNISFILLSISSILSIFNYNSNWAHFIFFSLNLIGFIMFFMSVGEGISIGVFTKVGRGLFLTGFGMLLSFIISFQELTRNSISRFMD